MPRLSIIIPTLNEAEGIAAQLAGLSLLRQRGHEVIVADGGSHDGTAELARPRADAVIDAPRGRATQMNAGAACARGEVLLFLHADTRLPVMADELIFGHLPVRGCHESTDNIPGRDVIRGLPYGAFTLRGVDTHRHGCWAWGRFDVIIEGLHPLLPVIAWFMNRRSRWTGIATGDQAMFVRREVFDAVGGFPDIALMEDIALSKILKSISPPLCLKSPVVTSGRRWERHGVLRTILKMWSLRLAYFLGGDPARLAKVYGYEHRDN